MDAEAIPYGFANEADWSINDDRPRHDATRVERGARSASPPTREAPECVGRIRPPLRKIKKSKRPNVFTPGRWPRPASSPHRP